MSGPRNDARPPLLRVGIVDGVPTRLRALTSALNEQRGLHVVAVGGSIAELLTVSRRMDVILLDADLHVGVVAEAGAAVLRRTGARVLPLRGDHAADIVRCVIAALPALRPTDPAPGPGDAPLASPGLSQRQQEVLRLYAQGSTADHVARQLFVSRETVLDHIRRIRAKYALVDRPAATKVELFQRAVEDGILAPDPPAST
ncbi:response regulator transcription factor [Microbacterium sp. H83]|uniref:response regulator transcription factor n=1 Tax=Microbacterium sp. H83 TaxID=1827324 RepID=UPI000AD96206|nr:LuxR C-terminal-related transcriptional regulator [Microbacterium sp. H83]